MSTGEQDRQDAADLLAAVKRAAATVQPLEEAAQKLDDRYRSTRTEGLAEAHAAIEAVRALLKIATTHQRRVGGVE